DHGRQDVQGHDRRAAGLADQHVPRARPRGTRPRGAAAARAGRRDRARRRAAQHALLRRGGAALSACPALPVRQDASGGRHDRRKEVAGRARAARRLRTFEFYAHAELAVQYDYGAWNDYLEAVITGRPAEWDLRAVRADGDEPVQVCLPYLRSDWVRDVRPLP